MGVADPGCPDGGLYDQDGRMVIGITNQGDGVGDGLADVTPPNLLDQVGGAGIPSQAWEPSLLDLPSAQSAFPAGVVPESADRFLGQMREAGVVETGAVLPRSIQYAQANTGIITDAGPGGIGATLPPPTDKSVDVDQMHSRLGYDPVGSRDQNNLLQHPIDGARVGYSTFYLSSSTKDRSTLDRLEAIRAAAMSLAGLTSE